MKIFQYLWLTILVIAFSNCTTKDDPNSVSDCDEFVLVDKEIYADGPKDFITIESATISGGCLVINYAASGCSGASWEVKLLDKGAVAESLPVQRFLRLSLKNEEACLAVFTKSKSFDLSPIQLSNESKILLNIEGFEDQILYEY